MDLNKNTGRGKGIATSERETYGITNGRNDVITQTRQVSQWNFGHDKKQFLDVYIYVYTGSVLSTTSMHLFMFYMLHTPTAFTNWLPILTPASGQGGNFR
jgi:hypothetical protein